MRRNNYIYIGLAEDEDKLCWDRTKEQLYKVNKNVVYVPQNKKKQYAIYLIGILLVIGLCVLNKTGKDIGLCLIMSGIEGILFALVSIYYTRKIDETFYKVASPDMVSLYEIKSKQEWMHIVKDGRKRMGVVMLVRLLIIFSTVVLGLMTMISGETFFLICHLLMWWVLVFVIFNISVFQILSVHRQLKVKVENLN